MDSVIPAAFLISFLITFSVIPLIISISKKKKLLDIPGGRKIHKGHIPSLGGIAIFIGFITSMFMWSSLEQIIELRFIYVGILMVVFTGIRDDLLPLSALYKLIWQIVAAYTVVHFANIRLTSMHGIFGVYEINDLFGYLLSIFTIIVITNSFNLIDGINGLAGSIAVIVMSTFGIWFYLSNDYSFVLIIVGLVGSVLAFLKFNYTPAHIFMGDTGSLLIGFVTSIIAIRFIEMNDTLPDAHYLKFTSGVAMGASILVYPLFDTLRIFTLRILQKRSPFSPDKNHIHHLILRLSNSHTQATLILCGFNLIAIFAAYALKAYGNLIGIATLFGICLAFGLILNYLILRLFPRKTPNKNLFSK
ncbi:MAG: glycosyltransferase family 4 protein [Flammeovirgaceae bacterium]